MIILATDVLVNSDSLDSNWLPDGKQLSFGDSFDGIYNTKKIEHILPNLSTKRLISSNSFSTRAVKTEVNHIWKMRSTKKSLPSHDQPK